MTQTKIINIKKQFSATPGPRYIKEGRFSGEEFRKSLLYPFMQEAIENDFMVEVQLDGTAGYATSFLEESFGGLIRVNGLGFDEIKKRLVVISKEEEYLIDDINQYIFEAYEEISKG